MVESHRTVTGVGVVLGNPAQPPSLNSIFLVSLVDVLYSGGTFVCFCKRQLAEVEVEAPKTRVLKS